jgi:hypothetical protein
VPEFRTQKPWRALLPVGIAAGVGLIWLAARSTPSSPLTVAELPQARAVAAASHAPPVVAPAAVAPAPSAEMAGIEATATPETIAVTVHISPSDDFVFKDRQRLGKGDVTVNVAPGTKTTLVARLDGHTPRTLVLDGSYTSVNIVLSRAEASRAEPGSSSPSKPAREVAASGDAPAAASSPSEFNPYD